MTHQPIEHRVDDETVIRVTWTTNPITGRASYHAVPLIGGYEVPGQREADTADAAYRACLDGLTERRALDAAAEQLADAGLYADLTGRTPGIHRQLEQVIPSPARPGECPTCGLPERTCDCR